MRSILSTCLALAISAGAFAQRADGTTRSLVKAENEYAAAAAKNGLKAATDEYASATGLVFRPNPVNARTYNSGAADIQGMTWEPVFARVSRSGDWGVTTGEYSIGTSDKKYGSYLSVWKAENDRWKVALDIGTEHNKPLAKPAARFVEPKDHYKPKFANAKEIKAGKDIILTTEKTLNTMLKTYGVAAFAGFSNADARLLFPGNEPIVGKEKILQFMNGMVSKINLKTTEADKAAGGDLAYTYGLATVDYKTDLREAFNYVFVWERQSDHTWNIIAQVFVSAER
ncbi:cysteinyl-tRNA synthetase [Pedobacter yulinensis]|uniref:Cysteinyl-tRNA synthetase n=1 Tax=Pedobacter yulinensis TaxID=2126353 RepID=A0A2T3HP19_9SPHI|nr:nuclear transport factor 2 family protein [Pedobacter yulinensis]PST84179.1 cysteinyl-tRNA synthetase [Pedobacter yulinensis]